MKYRKKPVEIEARQLTPETREAIAKWVGGGTSPEDGALYISTLEGTMIARDGDFIIQGLSTVVYNSPKSK
jgi:hypothetical protein